MTTTARSTRTGKPTWSVPRWQGFARRLRVERVRYRKFLAAVPPLRAAKLTDWTALVRPLERIDSCLRAAEALARKQHPAVVLHIAPPEPDLAAPWSSPMGALRRDAVTLDPDQWARIANALRAAHDVAFDLRQDLLSTTSMTGHPAMRFGALLDAVEYAMSRMQALAERQHPGWYAGDVFDLTTRPTGKL